MERVKIRLNYGNDFRVFDATLAIIDQVQGTGFVIALAPLELERYVFLAPGKYLLQAIYDIPSKNGGKQSCLVEQLFQSEEVDKLSVNFKKPTSLLPGFSQPEQADLEGIFKSMVGNHVNLRSEQVFVTNVVKQISKNAFLEERVVIDKNGKVEYDFSFNELYPDEPNELAYMPEPMPSPDDETVIFSSVKKKDLAALRPYTVHALNYGYWNQDLYGFNANIGAAQQGWRSVRSIAYLRPRPELFNRLPNFIAESMSIARRVNEL